MMNEERKVIRRCAVCGDPIDYSDGTSEATCKCNKQRKFDALARKLSGIGWIYKEMNESCFENDKGFNPEIVRQAKEYADQFPEMLKNNVGIIFYGSVGTGKTFMAECIANEIRRGFFSTFTISAAQITQTHVSEQDSAANEYTLIKLIRNSDLMIIDDLGAERTSEYAGERMFKIIDERYTTAKPLIITTNLSPEELKKIRQENRSYNRALNMASIPIKMDGIRIRDELAREKAKEYKL